MFVCMHLVVGSCLPGNLTQVMMTSKAFAKAVNVHTFYMQGWQHQKRSPAYHNKVNLSSTRYARLILVVDQLQLTKSVHLTSPIVQYVELPVCPDVVSPLSYFDGMRDDQSVFNEARMQLHFVPREQDHELSSVGQSPRWIMDSRTL